MNYRTLGCTGIKVSPYCLGAMMFGGIANSDHDECIRIIHKALDSGINFLDTADGTATASPKRSSARRSRDAVKT
jgi:aryl-alcohol dehydrogenase-like predicted oxidoreductase